MVDPYVTGRAFTDADLGDGSLAHRVATEYGANTATDSVFEVDEARQGRKPLLVPLGVMAIFSSAFWLWCFRSPSASARRPVSDPARAETSSSRPSGRRHTAPPVTADRLADHASHG